MGEIVRLVARSQLEIRRRSTDSVIEARHRDIDGRWTERQYKRGFVHARLVVLFCGLCEMANVRCNEAIARCSTFRRENLASAVEIVMRLPCSTAIVMRVFQELYQYQMGNTCSLGGTFQ
ncbi:hypothetical protein Ae201684_011370 [Aphanomyces euteiches]|uniref:Uncharacterized protein n=1 Tax=Aphanomyces euteiches TaxID=100861 RepID=A0A6G0WV24_9STRA|nr:hypothetical protein Ae201684_011370 [Aphanomyces euteiches]